MRTVRPFVLEEIALTEVAEEGGFDIDDQMEITKYLKAKVDFLVFLMCSAIDNEWFG